MALTIRSADFHDPSLAMFLKGHLADMAPHSPWESQHVLDLTALQRPTVQLWAAWEGQRMAGTCALAVLTPVHAELKSMRTEPEFRGQGVARHLLRHALANAQARNVGHVSLETGTAAFFAPARTLYKNHGFVECPPFGSYIDDPHSVYMTRAL